MRITFLAIRKKSQFFSGKIGLFIPPALVGKAFVDFLDKFLSGNCNDTKKLILEVFSRPGQTINELHPKPCKSC